MFNLHKNSLLCPTWVDLLTLFHKQVNQVLTGKIERSTGNCEFVLRVRISEMNSGESEQAIILRIAEKENRS